MRAAKALLVGLLLAGAAGCVVPADDPVVTPDVTLSDAAVNQLALDMVWEELSPSDRVQICNGVDLFGLDGAAAVVVDSADGSFTLEEVKDQLIEVC
jgi:hypothetical protein